MRRLAHGLMILFLVLASVAALADDNPATETAKPAIPANRIAVMNLHVSGEYSDQVAQWLPAMIEDQLLEKGWTLLVRGERMQHIQEERNLPGVNPETKAPDNQILGATALMELNCRIQTTGIQGIVGIGNIAIGDWVRASVDLNGQIVDVATGVLKTSVKVGGSASGLKTIAVVALNRDWDVRGGGFNLEGIKSTLVGKAADTAVKRLVSKLDSTYPNSSPKADPRKTKPVKSISADAAETIMLDISDPSAVRPGDRYGVYRADKMIAELEVIRVVDRRAEAKFISKSDSIKPTDKARRMPMVIQAE